MFSYLIVLIWAVPIIAISMAIENNAVATIKEEKGDLWWYLFAAAFSAVALPLTILLALA
jgi:hypothetical protein